MTFYSGRLVGGIDNSGISDFHAFLENTESYHRNDLRGEYGDERNPEMSAILARMAPLANVGRITHPMLVMHGANNPRVPQSQSDQMVSRLRANGVPVWYAVFSNEGNGFSRKSSRDLALAIETVFLRRLFGSEEITIPNQMPDCAASIDQP